MQELRFKKVKYISQEVLIVSKWESQDAKPDLANCSAL